MSRIVGYDDLYNSLKQLEAEYNIKVRPRSQLKYERGEDRDILIKSDGITITGIYVAKDKFKFWTTLQGWSGVTKYKCFGLDDKGCYKYYVDTFPECVEEVKRILEFKALNIDCDM